jgi:16S rRNA (cytosine1402-N4)-methyltransferase
MSLSFLVNDPRENRLSAGTKQSFGFAVVSLENIKNVLNGGKVRSVRHEPVMINEILEVLPLRPGATVVDGTLGLGGHSLRFLDRIRPDGTLVGFDWDEQMLAEAKRRIGTPEGAEVHLIHEDFRSIKEVMNRFGKRADGILLDLGLNSAQVDDAARGFSFQTSGPLDMRMDRSKGEPAAALLNRMSIHQIGDLLKDLGDERWAVAIARKVIERRKESPLKTTQDLVDCVLAAIPPGARDKRIHPATRTFQAIRIAVNQELEGLEEALRDAAEVLNPGGVLAVLSYHSGEDRIVKHTLRDLALDGYEELTKKPRTAGQEETVRNLRSRSAKLRALKRLKSMQT